MKLFNKNSIVTGLAVITGLVGVASMTPVTVYGAPASSVREGLDATGDTDGKRNINVAIETVVNVLLFILGAISVIMIILGGIKYTLSNGEAAQITSAKNTIMYAVIGLVVALLAYAIVNFVIDQFLAPVST